MRLLIAVALVAGLLAPALPVHAQDTEAIRRDMEQMRKQFEAMQEQYRKTMETMADRLQRLESPGQQTATTPVAAPPATAQLPPPTPPGGSPPSPMDLIRPRQPFALYERRGPGQLLFDMGVTGDFIGNLTQSNVEKNQGGSFSGLENLFFPREVELSFFGQVDPYARAEVRVESGQGSRNGELTVNLAEANLTLMTLPYGTQLKMGRARNRFGLLNELHSHDRPFIDDPNVLVQFFGREGLRENGFEATWVPALPFYLQILGGVFNGENEVAFGRNTLRHPLATGRIRTFFDLEDFGAIQLGSSIANGDTPEQKASTIIGFDVKYKYTPTGWQRALFTAYGEYLISLRDVLVTDSGGIDQTSRITAEAPDGWTRSSCRPPSSWVPTRRIHSRVDRSHAHATESPARARGCCRLRSARRLPHLGRGQAAGGDEHYRSQGAHRGRGRGPRGGRRACAVHAERA